MSKEKWVIEPTKFKDVRTGEVVTSFNIMDIKYMVKVEDEFKPCSNRHWHHQGTTCKVCGMKG